MSRFEEHSADEVRHAALPLAGRDDDYRPLFEAIGDARFVLLGEATHGTHEFYATRAQITQELIARKGFSAVLVEADWPDADRVNRFVRGIDDDRNAVQALASFKRFPTWMWRNTDVADFVAWLRDYNLSLPPNRSQAGIYGMDLYSLYGSIEAVLQYLDRIDHSAATRARYRYACFEQFGEDPQAYGYAASFDLGPSCEDEVIQQLLELRRRPADYPRADGRLAQDEHFYAEQNARLVKNAEQYYRSMFSGRVSSWNVRDQHMAETLDALAEHLTRHNAGPAKIVVWAHNSHLGDARATEMGQGGQLNVGQLVRERYGHDAFLIGFTTHTGTVTAASEWNGPAERKRVLPSLPGSYERLFHETAFPQFLLLTADQRIAPAMQQRRLERAIGVIYAPRAERLSHYFHADLGRQFDAVIHFDETRAVEPLERWPQEAARTPETFPTGV